MVRCKATVWGVRLHVAMLAARRLHGLANLFGVRHMRSSYTPSCADIQLVFCVGLLVPCCCTSSSCVAVLWQVGACLMRWSSYAIPMHPMVALIMLGLQSHYDTGENVTILDSVIMGADYYEHEKVRGQTAGM